jgi:hypothetical protein
MQSRKISANSFLAERKQTADRDPLCRIFLKKPSFFRTDFFAKLGPQIRLLPVPNFGVNNECHESFQILKKELIPAPIIQPPDWNIPFEIMCDASDFAVGVVLGQTKDKKHYAISYASKTLSGP